MELNRKLCTMCRTYVMPLIRYRPFNSHERSEFTTIFTSSYNSRKFSVLVLLHEILQSCNLASLHEVVYKCKTMWVKIGGVIF